ncbi:hypothetical protein Hanom_Chr13g01196961 [Helianthus anomalus]
MIELHSHKVLRSSNRYIIRMNQIRNSQNKNHKRINLLYVRKTENLTDWRCGGGVGDCGTTVNVL